MEKNKRPPVRLLRWVLMAFLLLAGSQLSASEPCLKRVFNEYCLGGDIEQLMRQRKGYVHQEQEGERRALIYADDRDLIYVLAFQGRIYKVVRKYGSETLITFEDLLRLLNEKYGPSSDESRYPAYVRSQASKIGAIRRGDGRERHSWRPTGQSWFVRLTWTRELGLALEYVADEVASEQSRLQAEGL
jgi:hypothetical protein